MLRTLIALLPLALPSPGAEPPRSYVLDEVPPQLADAVKRADAAAQALQRKLSGRLMEAMKQGGPAGAVNVCRDEAARLTEEAARETGAVVGRTSDRLRNPRNVAPRWSEAYVAGAAGKPASEVRPVVFDLRDEVGVLRPIAVAQPCTKCHGQPAAVPPDVAKILRAAYPDDRAIGYAEGDHRGFVWVVVPR
jgi:hypothetical protein